MDLRFKCERKILKLLRDSIREYLSLSKRVGFFNKIRKCATPKEKLDNFDCIQFRNLYSSKDTANTCDKLGVDIFNICTRGRISLQNI